MYRRFVRRKLRSAYADLSKGDCESVVKTFGPASVLEFAGTHALGGERRGADAVRTWFGRLFELFPGLRLEPRTVVVDGWPWDTRVAVRFSVRATLPDGSGYANEGMQFLRMRWGRVVEDRLYEDTQKLAAALDVVERTGRGQAAAVA
jgi:ketosteroid isomerase-like protein